MQASGTGMRAAGGDCAYIVILNWNGWRDTIECLESVLRMQGVRFRAVVCDNASSDGSLQQIAAWADGALAAGRTAFLPDEPIGKPLPYARYTRAEAQAGPSGNTPLVLIDNGANLGFAGGCNVGIRYAMTQPDCGYVWLLNNDTVVDREALAALVSWCREHPRVGLCGSQVRFYGRPQLVQTFGGLLDRRFCTTHTIACGDAAASITAPPPHIDYVPGASMMATRRYLDEVGLMSEEYFLYFEEIDWAERGKGRFDLAVCPAAVVYHRGAASIGSPAEQGERGVRSEYFLLRGRLMFARKFYKARLPLVYAGLLVSLLRRVQRRQWPRARVAWCALTGRHPEIVRQLLAPRAVQP